MTTWIVAHTPFKHGEVHLDAGEVYDGPVLAHMVDHMIVDSESARGQLLVKNLEEIRAGQSPTPFMDVNRFDKLIDPDLVDTGEVPPAEQPGPKPELTLDDTNRNIAETIERLNEAGMDLEPVEDAGNTADEQVADDATTPEYLQTALANANALNAGLEVEVQTAGDDAVVTDEDLTTDLTPPPVPATAVNKKGTAKWSVMRGDEVVAKDLNKAGAAAMVESLNAVQS
jgi:hypothetical protein